jgi:PleD family two-component response regulator
LAASGQSRRRCCAGFFEQASLDSIAADSIATLRRKDDIAASILKRADQALYRAKRDGRNRVVPDAA